MELWDRLQPTDWLTITPGVFWLPRPRGQLTVAGTTWDSTPLPLVVEAPSGCSGRSAQASCLLCEGLCRRRTAP